MKLARIPVANRLKAVVEFFLPMTAQSRIVLSLVTGLALGIVASVAFDLHWVTIHRYGLPELGYASVSDLIIWLTLAIWFFIFIKWAQGKDLSNKLKLLEIRKLEIQIAIVQRAHPELKELPS